MSNRTAESNKAIAVAWENEQKRVREGKGTRDWTPEQQNDILERGRAYDDDGKAFRGHHMRSVSICPEEQGDPDNIQFLSHKEHIEAHITCWHPTNWYYDPVTKQRVDFGDGPIIPCKVIELSNPVVSIKIASKPWAEDETSTRALEGKKDSGNATPEPKKVTPNKQSSSGRSAMTETPKPPMHDTPDFLEKAGTGIAKAAKATGRFVVEHKEEIIGGTILVGGAILKAALNSNGNDSSGCGNSHSNSERTYIPSSGDYSTGENGAAPNRYSSDEGTSIDRNCPKTHVSPREHIVPRHGQHYNTKEGRVWIEKDPYPRGGKTKDTE